MNKSAIIIGAGIGGLATAIKLRLEGLKVTVLERLPTAGGRCHRLDLDGFKFDTGPTLLMMVEELEELFLACGKDISAYLRLIKLDTHACFHFHGGEKLYLTSQLDKLTKEFECFESGAGKNLSLWMKDNQALMEVGMNQFINRNSPKYLSILRPGNFAFFLKGTVTYPIYSTLSRYFQDQRLKDAIAFSTLYLGLNPFTAPSIYSVLPYAELNQGLYFPMGGMVEIAGALEKLAKEIGVDIKYNTEVTSIEKDKNTATAVLLNDGGKLEASTVVINADLPRAYTDLLKEKHPRQNRFSYSCGAYLILLGVSKVEKDINHHQVFMPKSFQICMQELFEQKKIPEDPVFYMCCPSISDPSLAPGNNHLLSILVPVPATINDAKSNWTIEGKKLRDTIMNRLSSYGIKSSDIVVEKCIDPTETGSLFRLANDAAFGLSHNLSQMGPFRPANQHHRLKNVYFVGASTHPGNGIPMVLISGKLTAKKIISDLVASQ